ncbi:hypothetical protein E6H17_06360 [Candidatus Bathyarchaeota archaeon]|nr:MAG: hypothetical protein E6H17_06360 [Candidatus Bathyarchaeota archaeon]TMI76490.1 MAG: hypothetical protein E6H11_00540 [Candidatus Bathyarchaeota archaeon]
MEATLVEKAPEPQKRYFRDEPSLLYDGTHRVDLKELPLGIEELDGALKRDGARQRIITVD